MCGQKLVNVGDAITTLELYLKGSGGYLQLQSQIFRIPYINFEKQKIESMPDIVNFYLM